MKKLVLIATCAFLALFAFLVGRFTAGGGADAADESAGSSVVETWTCPMHPEVRLPDDVPCPLCGMDLVPLSDADDPGPRRIAFSPEAALHSRFETHPVERGFATRTLRLVGKIDYDETAVHTISAWVPGRLERLFVDYTGIPVAKGDHLVELYSPELLTAQEELLAARRRLAEGSEKSEFLRASDRRAVQSSRDKLRLYGLTDAQVAELEERGAAADRVTLYSPQSGVVIEKAVDQGAVVMTGTRIYRIADLSHLWVKLDAYEQDLAWLSYGQRVTLRAEAFPGERFEGVVSFIDPLVDRRTRTASVRVNVANESGRLKPGMFVHGEIEARLGEGGVVLEAALEGKWISPMHPEIVKDGPGSCDVCGMDLVPAESLGLGASGPVRPGLLIPHSAVLLTGTRGVVYVEDSGAERPTYEGREVLLGPRADDVYLVRAGLEEGERVVTRGAFRIDSAMQIRAKESMLSMGPESFDETPVTLEGFDVVLGEYLELCRELAMDDEEGSKASAAELARLLEGFPASAPPERLADAVKSFTQAGVQAAAASDIASLRVAFEPLSLSAIAIVERTGNPTGRKLEQTYCPMAFDDQGAPWLQVAGEDILNPYFGDEMLHCGAVEREWPAR